MDIIEIRKHAVNAASSIEDMTLERLQIFEDLFKSIIGYGYTKMIPLLTFSRVDTFHIQVKSNLLQDIYSFWLLRDVHKNLEMIDIMHSLESFVLHLIDNYNAVFINNKLFILTTNYGYLEFGIYYKAINFVLTIKKYYLMYRGEYLIDASGKKEFLEKLIQHK